MRLMRSRWMVKPLPGVVGTVMAPVGLTVTSGSMMSWVQ
jgi:hypothetical protein